MISVKLSQCVLEALYVCHPGIVNMKGLAQSYVWWLNMEDGITAWVKSCRTYQELSLAPLVARGNVWESPKAP